MPTQVLPILVRPTVYHLGDLDASRADNHSHEGRGVSVTQNPHDWSQITPLPGEGFELGLPNAAFLDFHEIKNKRKWRKTINEWAVSAGLLVPATVYRMTYYDDEFEESMAQDFIDEAEARSEAEAMGGRVKAVESHRATDKLMTRQGFDSDPGALTADLAICAYIEDCHPELQGVWWDDDLDVSRYSAPRGVIFSDRLSNWVKRPMNLDDMPYGAEEMDGYDEGLDSDLELDG